MPFPPTAADLESEAVRQGEDAAYYRRVLHEMIDMGADMVRTVHWQNQRQIQRASDAPMPDLTAAFDRAARSVRRSIALARSLDEPAPARVALQRRAQARAQIVRGVEDVIQRKCGEREGESLRAELAERMEGLDRVESVDGRPIDEVIAEICRDLGIAALPGTRPWQRRTPADVAALFGVAVAEVEAPAEEAVEPAVAGTVTLCDDGSCFPTYGQGPLSAAAGSEPLFENAAHGT